MAEARQATKPVRPLHPEFYRVPKDLGTARLELAQDLAQVPVKGETGEIANAYEKFEASPLLNREGKDLIWICLCTVREAFKQLEETRAERIEDKGYQWNMNWQHVRAEIDQVLEASRLLGFDQTLTRDAVLASIFSDCAKNRDNFIVHNIDGACAAQIVLEQVLDLTIASNQAAVTRILRAVKEHQIAPPEFMARVVATMLCRKQGLENFQFGESGISDDSGPAEIKASIRSIFKKIKDPFAKSHLSSDLSTISFSNDERVLLAKIGIEDWFVPHPDNPNSRLAHAVIAGDHSVNYNHPEGFAKIALLRGPDTEEIFKDPTIHHSLESAIKSFADSFRVIKPEVQTLAVEGLRKTMQALARITVIMTELFSGLVVGPNETSIRQIDAATAAARATIKEPGFFSLSASMANIKASALAQQQVTVAFSRVDKILADWYETYGAIPYNPKDAVTAGPGPGTLPFWNAPLRYPDRDATGNIIIESLSALEQRQFLFAGCIRDIAVELLRAESWLFGFAE